MNIDVKNYQFEGGIKKLSMGLILLGVVAFVASFSMDKAVGWVDYLVSTLYFTTVAVSGLFFMALSGVVQASWLTPYKRVAESMTKFLPIAFVLMIGTYFGMHTIYEWTHADLVANDAILREKVAYLNEPFFLVRMFVIFALWIGMSAKLRSISTKMDTTWSESIIDSQTKWSALGIIVFGLTISVASWDWIMSIEPHWFSTIFGVGIFAGSFVSGIAFITITVILLKRRGYFEHVNDNHLHDLGKWMFGMSVFWAYIWVSQYILIWYANIPEETIYYVDRLTHWNTTFFVNVIVNFILPFFLLMTRGAKRNSNRLLLVATIILIGHFIDLYLMVAPKIFHHYHAHITGFGIVQALQLVGMFGLFIFVVGKSLSKVNIVAKHDPTLEEGCHLHQ